MAAVGRLALAGLVLCGCQLLAAGSGLVGAGWPGALAAQPASDGEAIFESRCAACHTIGGGVRVGPDLAEVTTKRDRDWLARFIAEPDRVLAEGDPLALALLDEYRGVPMPNLNLADAEVAAVLAFLEAQAGDGGAPRQAAAAAAVPAGDPAVGRSLFVGGARFENGAPACVGCHNTADLGALGGGTLGPDLTNLHGRYGDTGLVAALESLPFPTMQGVYGVKPLTEDEVGHLYAFFVESDRTAARPVNQTFVLVGVVGFVILSVLGQLIWRNRLTAVREPLVGGRK